MIWTDYMNHNIYPWPRIKLGLPARQGSVVPTWQKMEIVSFNSMKSDHNWGLSELAAQKCAYCVFWEDNVFIIECVIIKHSNVQIVHLYGHSN